MHPRLTFVLRLVLFFVLLAGLFVQPRPVQAASLPAEINKQFTPLQIDAGGVSVLRVTIFNPNVFELTNASWTDNLVGVQAGLYIADSPGIVNTCGGAVTAVPGTSNLALNGGTVPAQAGQTPGQCYVEVNVSSVTAGNLINTIPANNLTSQGNDGGTIVNITNTTPASATITIIGVTPPSLTKAFSPNTIFVGQVSRLTITINNNDANTNLTGTSYTDTLPGGVILANPVNATATNCGVGYSLNANAGGNTVFLSSATVTPSLNCVVQVNVTGASGAHTNTIPAGPGGPGSLQTDQGVTNNTPATAPLNIQPVGITKSFNPVNFQAGGITTLTITLQNPTGSAYTGVGISDPLPGVLIIATPPNATNSCGGTLTATAGSSTITLSGGTIPASASPPTPPGTCTITVQVTAPAGATGAAYTNTIPANNLTADQPGVTNVIPATAPIAVYPVGTGIAASKSFSPSTIDPGQNSRLRIDITAPADTNLTNFSITDNLPAGVTISNSTPATKSANCIGGTLSTPTGATTISWTGGTINAGQMCRIEVWVTSSTSGAVTNTIPPGNITNDENRAPAGNINATLTVRTLSDLTVSKAFFPTQVIPSGISTLTITLQNVNASSLINVSATDSLTTMGTGGNTVRIAPVPNASTTCAGTLTAVAGTQTISLTGGTIPAQVGGVPGICTISVDVQAGTSTSTRTNTIPSTNVSGEIQGTGTVINAQDNATATLQILNLSIGVVKGFNPVLVYGGASSTLSVQLINPNNATLTGIAFTDDMTLLGTGLVIANPSDLNVGTCGGTLTGNPGDTSFSFSGGILAPNTNCTLTLSVTMQVNGNLTNRIPAGAVTTLNGVSSQFPTEASLTNLPGVSVTKVFNPAQVLTGQASTLTITIRNTSGVPVVNMGLADNLPGALPSGLEVANPANATNTCGGTLTANPGSQTIQLSGGSLAGTADCEISVAVISTQPGVYVNTIPAGALTADGGITNNDPTSDTLTVDEGVFSLGNRVWFDTDNSSTINGTEVGVDSVTVELYAADAIGNPTGAALGTTTTENGGYYRFDNLPAGNYVVVIPASQFAGSGPLAGYWSSGTTLIGGGVVTETTAPDPDLDPTDSDDNGTRQPNGDVISAAVTLGPAANEPTNDTDADPANPVGEAPDAQSNRTVDFGFYLLPLNPTGFSKLLNASNQVFTTGSNVAIGEIVTYQVIVNIPQGTFDNARLVDTMDRGLSFMDCISITGAGLTTSVTGGFASVCSTPTVDDASGGTTVDVGRRVTFDFGILTNSSATDIPLTITYRAVVLDNAGNLSGVNLRNSAQWTWGTSGSLGPARTTVIATEPELSISKNANTAVISVGDEVTITLTIQHTPDSETNAYDVVVTDTLPAELQYVPGSLECASGAQNADVACTESGGTITAQWSNFAMSGGNGQLTFRVTILSLPDVGIMNTANVAWTSLPGDVSVPQNSNVFSRERDYDPASQVDIYGASDTLVLGATSSGGGGRRRAVRTLPDTGFAPNVVTDLSGLPRETYSQTGDLTIEIPSLGVKTSVVGVPFRNGDWNVAWLGRQAGWLEGTSFPTWDGNSVITSHVYLSNGLPGPFVHLGQLKYGDKALIHAYGQEYTFEVRTNNVVEPNDVSAFRHEERPWLTLITCREYDEKTDTYRKRVVVRAVLLSVTGE